MTNKVRILGISGKKGSGKNTAANFIVGLHMLRLGIVPNGQNDTPQGRFVITEKGQLWVSHLLIGGEYEKVEGVIDIANPDPEFRMYLDQNLHPYIKLYSFADALKWMCIGILGLTEEQCYGTDDDKNSLTSLLWENMPGVVTPDKASQILCDIDGHGENPKDLEKILPIIIHEPGPMTAREVLQFAGSDIFRKMYPNVWPDTLMRRIKSENPQFAIIYDVRFPNECDAIQIAGGLWAESGVVLRLPRQPFQDTHQSETALDDYKNFDATLKDEVDKIGYQNEQLYQTLGPMGFVPRLTQFKK